MLDIGKMIKELRISKNVSQEELAEELNVNKATIANYEANRRALTIDKLEILLKVLGTTLEEFLSMNEKTTRKSSNLATKKIPILSNASAGRGKEAIDDALEWIELPSTLTKNADFATFIEGDSMEPKLHNFDLALVQYTEYLENGDIGIFNLNGMIYCKKFSTNPIEKKFVLKSLNQHYKPIVVQESDEFRVIGKVVANIQYNIKN